MSDERQMGRLEQGLETLAAGQVTIMTDLKEHRRESMELHNAMAKRISETEGDNERIEAKVDGHASEDDKRFATLKWIMGGAITLVVAVSAVIQAVASV